MLTNIVHNYDCLPAMRQMKDNQFDLAIVDPPYGIGDINQKASKLIHKKITWNNEIPTKQYFNELKRISKNRIIWGVNYYGGYISDVGRIIHDKSEYDGHRFATMSDADIASHSFGINIKIFRYIWMGNVQGSQVNWKNDGINGRIHPTQKPVQLYTYILKNYTKEGDTILDTHVGSGSSRIACYEMGFEFTGYEIDIDYWKAQEKRFNIVKNQQTLF